MTGSARAPGHRPTSEPDLDLAVAAPGARVALFGNPGGGTPAALPPLGRLIGGNVGILGFSASSLSRTRPTAVRGALRRSLSLLAPSPALSSTSRS